MTTQQLTDIQNVCDLITKASKYKFRKKEKIDFANKYWQISEEEITDLYYYLAQNPSKKNKQLARIIGDFVDAQSITYYRTFNKAFYHQELNSILDLTKKIKENGNWLSLYNLEREFTPKSTHTSPITYSYILQGDEVLTIDKNRANEILGILMDANIPTAKIIVTSSFPYYAKDDMNTYIKSLKK